MNTKTVKKPIMPTLRGMKVNQTEIYPIERYTTVKSIASLSGLSFGMEFSTSVKRDEGIVLVTRIA
jgi:hypothetical protein